MEARGEDAECERRRWRVFRPDDDINYEVLGCVPRCSTRVTATTTNEIDKAFAEGDDEEVGGRAGEPRLETRSVRCYFRRLFVSTVHLVHGIT